MCTHSKGANEQMLNSPKCLAFSKWAHDVIQLGQFYAACCKNKYTCMLLRKKERK